MAVMKRCWWAASYMPVLGHHNSIHVAVDIERWAELQCQLQTHRTAKLWTALRVSASAGGQIKPRAR
jgi:hypothetical protein